MSDITSASYDKCYSDKCDNGNNSMGLILLLLLLCGGNDGLLGGGSCGSGKNSCGIGGMDGILPLILILCLCGGF
ncbi:MAG: chorion class high-cysteine HCB protein 13 [Clostridiales bacterium]|nr:chorion class high-cysteine HCB protein 13 [Clostridiales bacterium]